MASPTLSRVVRFHLSPQHEQAVDGVNTFAGQPMTNGLSAYYEVESWCHATPDPDTGFVESIYLIDKAVRHHVVPLLSAAFAAQAPTPPQTLVPAMFQVVDSSIPSTLMRISWRLSPYHELTMDRSDMQHILVKRRYTFSAAHRLRNPELDDKGNEALYGKCAWPSGHGHNYELDVSVATPIAPDANGMSIAELDEIVHRHVIDLFDHRNLDQDIEAFKTTSSTLENITVECHRLLMNHLHDERARMVSVRVWETDRTSCEYPPAALIAEDSA